MKRRGICPTCDKGPRPLQYQLEAGWSCSSCYQRKRFPTRVPRVFGASCACGCGRPAGSISGYAERCLKALWRRTRFFQTVTGTALSFPTLVEALGQIQPGELSPVRAEAWRVAQVLFARLLAGHVTIQRKPGSYRSAAHFRGWKPRARKSSPLTLEVAGTYTEPAPVERVTASALGSA
jgi:hypothetical protein